MEEPSDIYSFLHEPANQPLLPVASDKTLYV
jgi:hypothetical protein